MNYVVSGVEVGGQGSGMCDVGKCQLSGSVRQRTYTTRNVELIYGRVCHANLCKYCNMRICAATQLQDAVSITTSSYTLRCGHDPLDRYRSLV